MDADGLWRVLAVAAWLRRTLMGSGGALADVNEH